MERNKYHVLLNSSSLQYTDAPVELFSRLSSIAHSFFFIDRTQFLHPLDKHSEDRINVQSISFPPNDEVASFPVWGFSMSKWTGMYKKRHRIRHFWEAYTDGSYRLQGSPQEVELKSYGFLLEKLP